MALLKLYPPALMKAIDQYAGKNGYVKTAGASTKAGYRPAGRQMAAKIRCLY